MGVPGGRNTILSFGGDPADLLAALDSIVTAVDDVGAAIDDLSAGASLADIDASLSEMSGAAGEAASQMSGLADAEDAAGEGAGGLGEALGGLTEGFGGLFERMGEVAGGLLEFQAIMGVLDAVHNFVGNMIGMNEQFQRLDMTLKDMVGANRAQQLSDWVMQFATQVPFTTEAVQEATVSITAFGQNAQQVLPAVAAAAAAMSARGVTLDTATRAFIDAMNGRFVMLQNTLGISKEALVKFGLELNSKGQVINNSFVPAFEKLIKAKYPTILADQMGTFGGMLAEANDLLQLFAMHLGAPLFAMAQEGLGLVMQFVSDHSADLDHLAEVAGGMLADGFRFFGDVIQVVGQVLKQILVPAFEGLMNLMEPLVGPLGNVAGAFVRLAGAVGGDLVKGLLGVTTGFQQMTGTGQPLQGVVSVIAGGLNDLAGGINAVVDGVTQGTGPLSGLQTIVKPLGDTWNWLGQAVKGVIQWFTPVPAHFVKIGDAVLYVKGQASGFQQTFGGLISFFQGLGPILQNVIQWFLPVPNSFKQVGDAVLFVKGHASGFVEMLQSIGQFFSPLLPLFDAAWQGLLNLGEGFAGVFIALQSGPAWLDEIGNVFQNSLGPALANLWNAITNDLLPSLQQLGEALLPLMPLFQALGMAMALWATLGIGQFINALGSALTAIVNFATGVIEMISGVITIVAGLFSMFYDLLMGNWSKLGDDQNQITHGFLLVGEGFWTATFGNIINTVAGFTATTLELFQRLYDSLVGHSIIPDTVNAIAMWFGKLPAMIGGSLASLIPQMLVFGATMLGAFITGIEGEMPALQKQMAIIWGMVAGPLIDLGNKAFGWGSDVINNFLNGLFGGVLGRIIGQMNTIISTFTGKLASMAIDALNWGEDIIQNLISGILNQIPNLANAAAQAAQTIANLLKHSEPSEGPLKGDSQWGGHLVDNIIAGITGKLPELGGVTRQLAQAMVPSIGGVAPGAFGTGLSVAGGAGGLSGGNVEALLRELIQIEQAKIGNNQLGTSPVNAQLGSVNQQIGVNINGMQNLNSLSADLNFLFGLMYENAKRGAIVP